MYIHPDKAHTFASVAAFFAAGLFVTLALVNLTRKGYAAAWRDGYVAACADVGGDVFTDPTTLMPGTTILCASTPVGVASWHEEFDPKTNEVTSRTETLEEITIEASR